MEQTLRRLTWFDQINVYLLNTPQGLVLVDSAMPGMFGWLVKSLRKVGVAPEQLAGVVVTILRGEAPHSVEQLIFGKPSFPQVQSLEAGQRLFGSTWRVVAAPGHTPGSLALFKTETGDLLSGDTLISDFGCPRANTSLFTADSPKLVESALNLMSLEPKIIHPAHGKPLPLSSYAKAQKRLVRKLSG